ncbi:MAG: chorismate mutase [Clostridiales bacterium]|nr:chorismate mutase [Clostridiales bacterium]
MEQLELLRNIIDETDEELIKLFEKRMETAKEIAEAKRASGRTVVDKKRERDIIARISGKVPPEMQSYARTLYLTLFGLSRSYQNRFLKTTTDVSDKIKYALKTTELQFPENAVAACQGTEGAYSQIACDKLFKSANIMYFNSFDSVFGAVEKGLCRYGILPIENSSYGSVTQVYDLMREHSFYIVRSIKLRVGHCLLAKPGCKKEDIKEIFSHEQAIGQCSRLIDGMKGVKVTAYANTAAAARKVAESDRNDVAAISSHECAGIYGLNVLGYDVQDAEANYTRFICISKNLEIYPGSDKISIMLSLPHRPGSLFELMSDFSSLGLNLTKLESRPMTGRDFEFMFYFDLDASPYSDDVLSLLDELSLKTDLFTFLGSYSEK